MSTTTNPRIITGAFSYTEDLKYSLYRASDPTVPISTQTFSAPHLLRTVTFNNMPRVNLIWKLWRVTGSGDVQVTDIFGNPLSFNFTPDRDDLIYYAPEEIIADTSVGVVSGTTSFTYDGTAGTPDWRGRVAYPEREGQGTINRSKYSWDGATGTFTILETGVTFNAFEVFNFTFDVVVQQSGLPETQPLWSAVLVVTGTTTLVAADWGKKIIIKGATPYFEITLPTAADIPENVVTYFEFARASHVNVKLKATGTTIDWGRNGARTYITGGVCENIALYKEPTTGVLRVHSFEGNFLTLGRIINTDDVGPLIEVNVQALDGSILNSTTNKRLYEDLVQQLPPAQVVNFTAWSSNRTKYSYANGTGNFHVPDRRSLYARYTDGAILPGSYIPNQIKTHEHEGTSGTLPTTLFGRGILTRNIGVYGGVNAGKTDLTGPPVDSSGNAITTGENTVETFYCNMFVLI